MRGKNGKSVKSNFVQYGLASLFLDTLTFDITRSPIRKGTTFDAIVCDRIFSQFGLPLTIIKAPYGVRAGAKRLGSRRDMSKPVLISDGSVAQA